MRLDDDWRYPIFCMFFILFGMTLISSVINLFVIRFILLNRESTNVNELKELAHSHPGPGSSPPKKKRRRPVSFSKEDSKDSKEPDKQGTTANLSDANKNGSCLSTEYTDDNVSICSCTCYKFLDEDTMYSQDFPILNSTQSLELLHLLPGLSSR